MIHEEDWRAFCRVWMKKDTAGLKQMVADGFDLNQSSPPDGAMTPMSKAISWSKGVELMLKLGADPDYQAEKNGVTALMDTPRGDCRVKSAELLIKAGANVNLRSNRGLSALWVACINDGKKPEKIAMMLLDAGAKAGVAEMIAAAGGSTPAVFQRLIDQGAPVNGIDEKSTAFCPLFNAIIEKRKPAIELLLQHGADPLVKMDDRFPKYAGMTMIEVAEVSGHRQIAQLLKDTG